MRATKNKAYQSKHDNVDAKAYRRNRSIMELVKSPVVILSVVVVVGLVLLVSARAASVRKSVRFSLSSSSTDGGYTFTDSNIDVAKWLQPEAIPILNPAEGSWPQGSLGNFRILCWASHLNYDDPIMYPEDKYPNGQGQGKAHLHLFFGNRSTNYQTTPANITTKGEGSCQGGPLNRSAYWIPALLDKNNKARIPFTTVFYYKTQGVDKSTVQALPTGLRMITGKPNAVSPQNNWRIKWICLGGTNAGVTSDLIPKCDVGSKLKLQLLFPQCGARNSDGTPVLDSTDHQSHMTYQDDYYHTCPATHPIVYPEISLNIIWNNTDTTTDGWYISSDRMTMPDGTRMNVPGGTTTHADWFMGWKPEIMQTFVNRCLHEGRNSNQGNLCDGTRLKMISGPNGGEYTGPQIVDPPVAPNGQVDMTATF